MAQNVGTQGQSFFGYAGIAEESGFGASTAPSVFSDIVSDGFSGDNGIQYLNNIRSRGRHEGTAGAYEDGGSVELAAAPENGLGLLMKAAFGESAVTTSDPDGDGVDEVGTHDYSTSALLPSLTVELGVGDIQAVRHVGCGVGSLELSHSSEEYLMASFDMTGKQPELQNTMAAPTYSDLRPFIFHDGTLAIDGTDRSVDVQELTISIENNIEGQYRMDDRAIAKETVGEREITAEATLDFSSADLWEKFLGGAGATQPGDQLYEGALSASWTSPETVDGTTTNYELGIDMPRVEIESREASMNENELIAEDVTFSALIDPATGDDMTAQLVNGRTQSY
jgi:hypothetical protein